MMRMRNELVSTLQYGQLVYKYKLDPTESQIVTIDQMLETLRRLYNDGLADRRTAEQQIIDAGLKVPFERTFRNKRGEEVTETRYRWARPAETVEVQVMEKQKDGSYREKTRVKPLTQHEAKPFYAAVDLSSQKKRLITALRKDDPFLSLVCVSSCQQCLNRLDRAFQAYYRRCGNGETPGFPKFRRRHEYNTIEFNAIGQGCRFLPDRNRIYVANVGEIKFHNYRPVPQNAEVRNLSVTRQLDGYYVNVLLETISPVPAVSAKPACGIDVGYGWSFVTTSDGLEFEPHRFYKSNMEKLAGLQRELDRYRKPDHRIKLTGSYRWKQQMDRIRKLCMVAARQRHQWHIDVANALAARYGTIYHENLSIKRMVKRPDARPNEDGSFDKTGAKATAHMRINTLDMAWYSFFQVLSQQTAKQGGKIIAIEASNSTQECSACHRITCTKIELSDREFRCTHCGHCEDRKRNAAKVMLYRGEANSK